MTTQNKSLKIVIALANDVLFAKAVIEKTINQFNKLNQFSANLNLFWCNEDSSNLQEDWSKNFFYETPIPLIEEINNNHKPDILICTFWGIFGSLPKNVNENEAKQLAKKWADSEKPFTKILFCKEQPKNSDYNKRQFITHFKGETYPYSLSEECKKSRIAQKIEEVLLTFLDKQFSNKTPIVEYKPLRLLPLKIPENWIYLNDWLKQNSHLINKELSDSDAANFFDGKIPNFDDITPITIPRRKINKELQEKISIAARANKFAVTLIHGAGGEGKSTILKQVAIDLLLDSASQLHIFYRDGEVDLSKLIDVLKSRNENFLIVSDNAWKIANYISDLAKKDSKPNNIQFLLGIRTTHWDNSINRTLTNHLAANFIRKEVGRLIEEDAAEIIKAFEKTNSLGNLADVKEDERVKTLIETAKLTVDKTGNKNSFFGSILWVRRSQTLDDRVKEILEGLDQKTSYSGKSLSYYFNYIVAMHGNGFYFLTKEVLAKAIGCDLATLNNEILAPLEVETAILDQGKVVLARHDLFAERAKELRRDKLNELLGKLAVAAQKLFNNRPLAKLNFDRFSFKVVNT